MRREFQLTDEQFTRLKEACQPVPYLVFGGQEPPTPQENANRAWCSLGKDMGFDGMTVEPHEKGARFFTAEIIDITTPVT